MIATDARKSKSGRVSAILLTLKRNAAQRLRGASQRDKVATLHTTISHVRSFRY
jgi:hypothetical protein